MKSLKYHSKASGLRAASEYLQAQVNKGIKHWWDTQIDAMEEESGNMKEVFPKVKPSPAFSPIHANQYNSH